MNSIFPQCVSLSVRQSYVKSLHKKRMRRENLLSGVYLSAVCYVHMCVWSMLWWYYSIKDITPHPQPSSSATSQQQRNEFTAP